MQQYSVLAIGAHPDDTVLGMGATLASLSAAGYTVHLLSATSGELGGVPQIRELEEKAAASCIGASVRFGRLMDGSVSRRDAIVAISEALKSTKADMVFVHDPDDTHQDHVNVAQAALAACKYVSALYFYEGPSSVAFHPHSVVDVSDFWSSKIEALNQYSSQMDFRRLMAWVDAVAKYRAWPRHVGAQCEAFRTSHSSMTFQPSRHDNTFTLSTLFTHLAD